MTNDKHAHVHALAHELGNHETRHNLLGIGNGLAQSAWYWQCRYQLIEALSTRTQNKTKRKANRKSSHCATTIERS